MAEMVASVAGVEVEQPAVAVAESIAKVLRDMAKDMPFGAEPQDFLVALEELADAEKHS